MNFQEKLFESTAQWRAQATAFASAALATARNRASRAAQRVDALKGSIAVLQSAGKGLSEVARRHVTRFVNENRAIAVEAGKDVAAVARSTCVTFSQRGATKHGARKKPATRKRKKAA